MRRSPSGVRVAVPLGPPHDRFSWPVGGCGFTIEPFESLKKMTTFKSSRTITLYFEARDALFREPRVMRIIWRSRSCYAAIHEEA